MGIFLLRRAVHALVVIFAAATVVFFISRVISDPAQAMVSIGASAEDRAQVESYLGLDEPLASQFAGYIGDLVTLDLGTSLRYDQPARDLVVERLPNTFRLLGGSLLVVAGVFIPAAIAASLRPGGIFDRAYIGVSMTGLAAPSFWVGTMLILLLSVRAGWFPTSGSGGLRYLVLPAVTLSLPMGARIGQVLRSAMIDALQSDYVTVARASGLPSRVVVLRYALRNAGVGALTMTGFEVARTFAGAAVIVEVVFAWPGIGFFTLQAMQRQDIVLLQACIVVIAAFVVVINLLTDIAHRVLTPQLRAGPG